MKQAIRIGTRESQLAVWQAMQVKELLAGQNVPAELVYIKSEGDIDLKTPLYEMGVQGIFTRSLDIALLNNRIDIAVHSMKDVPTQLPQGIVPAAALKRASWKDLLVYKGDLSQLSTELGFISSQWVPTPSTTTTGKNPLPIADSRFTIATSSIRRKTQWLNRYPQHTIENLRGNVNTRLAKVANSNWQGAIFAAAGLERINLRPEQSIELDWMLPAPAQGAIMVVCREEDKEIAAICQAFNDGDTALCTQIERDFLRTLLGGCSTPISALAEVKNGQIRFQGNILSIDGVQKAVIEKTITRDAATGAGNLFAKELLANGGQPIADNIQKTGATH
ncbi:hydroxymethylbilane synthase [Paraflavitalea soli]|uniref:Porphobilinogen deaminase n=1 Tax=Paraflavitalea soli TaxID=2315862 RepID=A0A3B7MTD3_9BACT|nr:hydroxymethylbilane synthase [Paraflavitalea soli]AXY77127.1 hydroxymethylbilane synthase [Paraflavitalea soli]